MIFNFDESAEEFSDFIDAAAVIHGCVEESGKDGGGFVGRFYGDREVTNSDFAIFQDAGARRLVSSAGV